MAKPRTFDHIIGKLTKNWGKDPDKQQKITVLKQTIVSEPPDPDNEMSSGVIEELILEITSLQSVVNDALIKSVRGNTKFSRIAEIYADVRKMKAAFEKQEKITEILEEAYEQLVLEKFESEGIRTVTLEDGSRVDADRQPHTIVVDRQANNKWAIENGHEELLSVAWPTLNALTKKAIVDMEPIPDGVDVQAWPRFKFTPAK